MATRRQKAAARRNIKKAQAARKRLEDNPAKKKKRGAAKRKTAKRTTAKRTTAKRTTTRRKKTARMAAKRPTRAIRRVKIKVPARRKGSRKRKVLLDAMIVHARPKRRVKRKAAAKRKTTKRATTTTRRSAAKRRPRTAKRRKSTKRRSGVAGGMMRGAMRPNPVKRRAKKRASARTLSKRRAARRRTQTFHVRRKTKRVKLVQPNPMHGLGYGGFDEGYLDNPLGATFGYARNPLGAITSLTTNPLGGLDLYDNPMGFDENPMDYDENPLGGLIATNPVEYDENPDDMGGAFSAGNLKRFGVAAGGVALGLVVADFLDRYVATRKPADDGTNKANNPLYGRDAAAAQRARPDAYRLGAQAVGAAGSIALAYQLRGKNWAPWVFGGLSLGFGSNLIKMIADFYLMPAIFKVKLDDNKNPDFSKPSFASRMYPLEQKAIQDKVKELFEKWGSVADLAAGQVKDNPGILSPLADDTSKNVYTLGRPQTQYESLFGAPRVLPAPVENSYVGTPAASSTVGATSCPHCGGVGGCFSGCPTSCPGDCPQGVMPGQSAADSDMRFCQYTVKPGDDLLRMVASVGVSVDEVAALNGFRPPSEFFVAGADVILPAKLCHAIELGTAGKVLPTLPPIPTGRTLPPGALIPNPEPGDRGGPPGPPSPANFQAQVRADVRADASTAVQAAVPAGRPMVVPTAGVMPQVMSPIRASLRGTDTLGAPNSEADREAALRSFGRDIDDA